MLESRQPEPLISELQESAGIAVLRVAGSDHTLAIRFGPHGSGHGHFDKLSLISYAHGARQAVDPGTQAYAAETHDTWDKMTIAHNIISVDGLVQRAATGRLLEWLPKPDVTAIRVSAGPVYPGVELERTLVHTAEYTLDVFTARATDSAPHQFDWIYHNYGAETTALPPEPFQFAEQTNGYQHLTETKATKTDTPWQVDFTKLRVRMLGEAGTTVVTGLGLGPDLRVPVPFVLARRTGSSARFIALYEPGAAVTSFTGSGDTITVQSARWRDEISAKPGRVSRLRHLK
jgi:hypothetical protein